MSEIKWVQLDHLWYEARIDIVGVEVVLKVYSRHGFGCDARVVVDDEYELAEVEGLVNIDAAKARAVTMLREIGTAMVRAADSSKEKS